MRDHPKERPPDILMPRPPQPGEAQQFPPADGKADRADRRSGEALDGKDRRPFLHRGPVDLARLAADDQRDKLLGRRMLDRPHADHLAVAQDRHAIRNAKDLVEAVADIDHPHAFGFQRAKGGEQPLHLIGGQARCGLVQHKVVAIRRQRAGDGDQRFLRPRQAGHPRGRRKLGIDKAQRAVGGGFGRGPVDAAAPARIAERKGDVFGHAHPVDEAEVLVDEGDLLPAHPSRLMRIGRPVDEDPARVGPVDPAKCLDEGGLARAVLTQKRHDLAGPHTQRDAAQGLRAAKGLDDAIEEQPPFGGLHGGSSLVRTALAARLPVT